MVDKIKIDDVEYVRADSVSSISEPDGDYVVVRTYSAGVHAGYLKSREGKEVVLTNTRRLWKWSGAASISQIAGTGITQPSSCQFPAPIAEIILTEVIEILPCTTKAKEIIQGVDEWVA